MTVDELMQTLDEYRAGDTVSLECDDLDGAFLIITTSDGMQSHITF